MSILRERVWQLCGFEFYQIRLNIDTTVKTVYGNQQGARMGYNTKHRGKEGLRPILCFIEETREYLLGKLRKYTTVDGKEAAQFNDSIKQHLPGCVTDVLLRADGEFMSWDTVKTSIESGFKFIIANCGCTPVFNSDTCGIDLINANPSNITAAFTSPEAGDSRVALWSCVFPKSLSNLESTATMRAF